MPSCDYVKLKAELSTVTPSYNPSTQETDRWGVSPSSGGPGTCWEEALGIKTDSRWWALLYPWKEWTISFLGYVLIT